MRKRNKGFTLIELLAVIVILALIALIAMPIILNIIKDAKRSAAKDSAYGYIDAVEKYIVLAKAKTGDYKLELVPTEDKELTCETKEALKTDTSNWKSDLNPRLITANEIAKITEHPTFDARKTGQSSFYFDSNNQTQKANASNKSKYAWLFDYTYDCTSYGCNKSNSSTYGYLTSTPSKDDSTSAWRVDRLGDLASLDVADPGYGVRPVITISKSNIS